MNRRRIVVATSLIAQILMVLSARRAQPESRLAPIVVSDTIYTSDEAQLVGDGVISTRDYEQNSSFSADGRAIFFSKRTIWPTYASVLCESHLVGGRWSEPTVLPFSGSSYDSDPFLTADGKRLYFASRRPVGGRAHRDRDIWYADRTATGWSAPQRLPAPVNSGADEAYPVIVRDGSLYFTSSPRDSTAATVDTYRAQWLGDRFGTPAELEGDTDRVYGRLQSYVSPDESYMIFVSWQADDTKTEAGIYSPGDLYVSERVNGTWLRGRHLPSPINSAAAERAPMVSADGRTMFFTSERGFATAHPERATRYEDLERHLHGSRNGLGDIYSVPLSMLGLTGARVATPPFLRVPEMVGPGVISTADDEYAGSLTPDGKTIYFNKSVPTSNQYTVVYSRLVAGRWTAPVVASFSGRYSDTDPEVAPDGRTLYFASDRPVGAAIKHDYDIWKVELRTDGSWGAPIHLPAPINTDANEYIASVTANGTLYVSSMRDGLTTGTVDIYRILLDGGQYRTATNVSHEFNDGGPSFADLDAIVSPDERVMIFSSFGRPDTYGSADLYVSYRKDGKWEAAHHLRAPFSSAARDYSPRFSPDGRYIHFSSERRDSLPPRTRALTYAELENRLRGTLNGGGNIYRISREMLDSAVDTARVFRRDASSPTH